MDPEDAGYAHIPGGEQHDLSDRKFETSMYDDYSSNPIVYGNDPDGGDWYHVECAGYTRCSGCGHRPVHWDSIIIAVDGGCRNNGTPHAPTAFAAYFYPFNTRYNSSSLLSGPLQTNQRAELSAGLLALNIAGEIKDLKDPSREAERVAQGGEGPEMKLTKVVIKSDSEYLVKGMTEWIYNWKQNGYRNARKKPVANSDLFKSLDSKVEALDRRCVKVQFWHVPREQNKMADYLVNCWLDGFTAEQAMDMYLTRVDGIGEG